RNLVDRLAESARQLVRAGRGKRRTARQLLGTVGELGCAVGQGGGTRREFACAGGEGTRTTRELVPARREFAHAVRDSTAACRDLRAGRRELCQLRVHSTELLLELIKLRSGRRNGSNRGL